MLERLWVRLQDGLPHQLLLLPDTRGSAWGSLHPSSTAHCQSPHGAALLAPTCPATGTPSGHAGALSAGHRPALLPHGPPPTQLETPPPPRHGTQTSIPVLIQKAPQVPACLPAPSLHSGLSVLPSLALTHRAVCLRVSAPKVPSAGNAPPLCVPLSEFQWLSLWSSAQKLLPQATSSDPLKQVKSPVSAPHHPVFSFTVLPAPGRAVSAHARVAASPRAASVRPPPSAQWARSWYSANVCHTRGAAWA